MCKHPAPECQPLEENAVDNETVEEDNDMSDDDDYPEPSDSDSYYTESSVDIRTDSESDGESASGHRVTPDMVLLLMLKQHGTITEEKYAEKAEKCENNFKFLIPNLPRSCSVDTLDYTQDLSGAEESNDEDYENNTSKDAAVTDDKGTVETSHMSEVECDIDITKDRKDIELIGKVNDGEENGGVVWCINVSVSISSNHSNEETTALQQEEVETKNYQKELEVNGQQDHESEVIQKEPQKTNLCDVSTAEKIVDTEASEEPNRDRGKYVETECTQFRMSKDADIADNQKGAEDRHGENLNNISNRHAFQLPIEIIKEINIRASEDTTNQDPFLAKPVAEPKNENHPNEETKAMVSDLLQKNNSEAVIDNRIESNNNVTKSTTKQDIIVKESAEECKFKDQNNESNSATGKITKSFKYILKKLIKEKRIPKEDEEDRISDEYGEDYGTHLLSFAQGLDRDYKDNTLTKLPCDDDEFSEDEEDYNLRRFAFFLNFYSPSSYKYILETYNTPLPDLKTLYSWYLKDDHLPGLSEKAFKILKEKSAAKKQTCTLMLIDIFLKNDGRYCDQVDYGQGEYYNFEDKAVLAYVFVLVSLDEDWKMPIGYILARNIPAETQAEYIRICLTHCHEAGVDVVAVTLDTPTPAECLGCSFDNLRNLKTTFKHPACDRDVAVWIDPCLALKSARQTLKVKGVLKDDDGKKIRWNLIRKLRRLHSDDDSTSLEKPEFFELRNHIAKIGLTSETFSESLIPALELGENLLPDLFSEVEPTTRYIAYINMLYRILNYRITMTTRQVGPQLHAAKKYLIHLFSNEENKLSLLDRENLAWKRMQGYRYFIKGEPACGFVGFLICIESFKHLFTTLVKKEKIITCLNPQRLCKVQAEGLVNNLRAYDYLDPDSLSADRFQDFYKSLLNHLEKNPQFSDKNVPLEHWMYKDRYSPAVTIKLTSGKRSYDDVYSSQYKLKKLKTTLDEDNATKLVREYSIAMDSETDLSIRKNMVGFLAGWIAAKFAKCFKCETCIDALCTNKKLWFHKYIMLRRIYALCLPSEEIYRICWECERALRLKGSPARLRAWVLRRLLPNFPWRTTKRTKHHPIHHIHLARAVIAKYIALRVPTPFSGKDRNKIVELFQRFTTKDSDDDVDEYRVAELTEWLDGSVQYDSD